MSGQDTASLLSPEELNCKLVFDIVYNPVETPLLRMARAKGIPVITGIEMFVQQGARQFEIWTGKPAPEEEMLKVILHSLRQSTGGPMEPSAPMQAAAPIPPAAEASEPEPAPQPASTATREKKSAPVRPTEKPKAQNAARSAGLPTKNADGPSPPAKAAAPKKKTVAKK